VFRETQERCARMLGDAAPPAIRLHDLQHTHATILLRDRENVKVVSERLGQAGVTVTLGIYALREAVTRNAVGAFECGRGDLNPHGVTTNRT